MDATKPIVCLIDDDEIFQFIFQRQMQNCNPMGQLLIFPNGKKGIEYLMESIKTPHSMPDNIFLDINMPIMNGWKFLENFSILKDQLPKHVNIYLVTSSIDERDMEKANLFKEVKEYLVKPISETKICEVLGN